VKKVIVYYIDIDDEKEIRKMIKDQTVTTKEIELRDLKQILDDVIEYSLKESKGTFEIEITKFVSDRLRKKIDEHNQKGQQQQLNKDEKENGENGNGNGNGDEENGNGNGKKKKKFSPIDISKDGLELIELISLDCTTPLSSGRGAGGEVWHSDKEIKIDKLGYVIADGKKTKTFWDAKVSARKNHCV
jgi:adenine-specific DNA-methyltransferase